MNAETFADTRVGHVALRGLAAVMESRLRYRYFPAEKMLHGANLRSGLDVLEIGPGTGYFTLPAAKLLGEQGSLVAMDRLAVAVEALTAKVEAADLRNVRVVVGNALDTGLETASFDEVLIFGVIPAPMLPMDKLLAEMHRLLRPAGVMAVWPPSWVHRTIRRSPLFAYAGRRNGVSSYVRKG